MDSKIVLTEMHRLLKEKGYIACMWNHRDLNNDLQANIEHIIKNEIPDYNYGDRRKRSFQAIIDSKLFSNITPISARFNNTMDLNTVVEAWRSHATLQRQAGDKFEIIIEKIKSYLNKLGTTNFEIP